MDLGKNIAGMPPLVLGGVVIAGLGIGWYINNRNKAAAPVLAAEQGVGVGGSGFDTVTAPPPPDVPPDTNESWRIRVTNGLIATGLYDPATVESALNKYLTGQPLNVQEMAIKSVAISRYGVPPESVPGPGSQGPSAVSGLAGVANGPETVTLTWLPSAGATSYHLIWTSPLGVTEWDVTAPINIRTDVNPDMSATWTVIAVNDFGRSDPRSVTVKTPPKPGGGGGGNGGNPQPQPQPEPAPAPAPAPRTYTIGGGDTLTGIAVKMYGNAGRWREIYNANAGTIESVARSRGKGSSSGGPRGEVGWWIFPGTVLNIP